MPACDYCDASFDDEDAYLAHLAEAHEGDLGPIDRRRVAAAGSDDDGGLSRRAKVVGALLVGGAAFALVFLAAQSLGGGTADVDAAQQPTDLWGVHYHGTIEVSVNGDSVDFSRDRYQLQADAFHFESGQGTRWHVHARGVTLEWAMASLGFDVNATAVTVGGETYRDAAPNTSVTVTVDGESVTPRTYVLQQGDEVRIVVDGE
jgi:hypothetical protein